MALSDLSTAQLKHLVELVKEKEALQGRLAKLNAELARLEASGPETARDRKRHKSATRNKLKSSLMERILSVLGEAGPFGLSVKEVASGSGSKLGSVSVWLYTSGKKVPGLKKIAPGRYMYTKT